MRASLYQQIGQLKVELDWMEKKWDLTVEERRGLIEAEHEKISVRRQCELLGISRSGLYYKARGENGYNLQLMREMGLYAIYPKPGLSKGGEGHKKYPYLLKCLLISIIISFSMTTLYHPYYPINITGRHRSPRW